MRGEGKPYIGCVYMPTDSTSVSVLDSCYERLKRRCTYIILVLGRRERLFCWVISMSGLVYRSAQLDDVVGIFGENTCNASGNRLLSFLNEVELMICNGRKLVSEPEWTRIRPSLKQKSII